MIDKQKCDNRDDADDIDDDVEWDIIPMCWSCFTGDI